MESFLKNRPVHTPAADTTEPGEAAAAESPFAPIQHVAPASPAVSTRTDGEAEPEPAGIEAGCSADGASVRAIMERGRVTRIVVTCSCGKVTEVACNY